MFGKLRLPITATARPAHDHVELDPGQQHEGELLGNPAPAYHIAVVFLERVLRDRFHTLEFGIIVGIASGPGHRGVLAGTVLLVREAESPCRDPVIQ